MRDFLPAIELFAKAVRSGLATVGALVDCGIPRQHAGERWLTEKEAEEEVGEGWMTADAIKALCACGHMRFMHRDDSGACLECNAPVSRPNACVDGTCCHRFAPPNSRTNAGATCNRAVEETSEGASPPAAPSDVLPDSWVAIAVPVIAEVLADHFAEQRFTAVTVSPYIRCHHRNGDICGEFADRRDHRDHVAPLIADRLEAVTLALPEEA